jgi:RND family efflux transporter MFP subunit
VVKVAIPFSCGKLPARSNTVANNDLSGLKIETRFTPTPARRWRRWLWVGLGATIVAGIILFFFTRPVAVETATVSLLHPSQTLTLLNASGYVVAQRKAAVAAQSTGRLVWLGVEEGSRVTSGQILARLEDRETAAVLEQAWASLAAAQAAKVEAEAELRDAQRSDQRMRDLLAQGFVAQAEADATLTRLERSRASVQAATANIAVAAAMVRGAEVALDNTRIRAPFDAVVLTKNADLGDIVTPLGAAANAKSAVVTIADLSSLQVEADVSEANLSRIRPGQPCEIILDAIPEQRFRGELVTIVPTADRSKATVLVKVRFAELDPRVLPEMSARVAILDRPLTTAEEAPKLVLPPAALQDDGGRKIVYRLVGARVQATPVVLGPTLGDQVEVQSGIAAGEKVVLRPLKKMRDNRRVKQVQP